MIATTSELLRKYDVAGPRYTSYPTILYWENEPTKDRWLQSAEENLQLAEIGGTGAAIYVHVPFCKSLCTYCGCNSRITCSTSVGRAYVKTVLKEWELYREQTGFASRIPLSEIHLGGGTPTFLTAGELDELLSGILEHVKQRPTAEFSLESDPRVTDINQLSLLHRLGFRRLSLGIQDFDPRVQVAVNRLQSERQVQLVTEQARSVGFTSVNYDLIYGLPFQNLNSIEQTVAAVIRLKPERIAFYAYAHVPWVKPGQRHFTEADLPAGAAKRDLYVFGRTMLEQAGYIEIGMDHFALKSDPLFKAAKAGTLHRNFMGYTSRFVSPLIGLGVSAISDSWDVFVQNEKSLETYQERVGRSEIPIFRGHDLSEEDKILRRHILNLMTRFETSWESSELFTPHLESIAGRLTEPINDGLVEVSNKHCRVTREGKSFLRNICMTFDARLARKAPATTLFSRTI